MNTNFYTTENSKNSINAEKRPSTPGLAGWKSQRTTCVPSAYLPASGQEDEEVRFSIYQRENLNDESDFSCGILYLPTGAPPLTMARYNGPSHKHGDIVYQPHIHRASERAIAAGKKTESQADATSRFQTLEGALACLTQDFNVIGLNSQDDDQLRMLLIMDLEALRKLLCERLCEDVGG